MSDDYDRDSTGTMYANSFDSDPYSDYDPMYSGPDDQHWTEAIEMPRTGFESYAEGSACYSATRNFWSLLNGGMISDDYRYRLHCNRLEMWGRSFEGKMYRACVRKWGRIIDAAPTRPACWRSAMDVIVNEFNDWLAAVVKKTESRFVIKHVSLTC